LHLCTAVLSRKNISYTFNSQPTWLNLCLLLPFFPAIPFSPSWPCRLLQLMLPGLLLSIVSETVVQFLLAQGEAVPGMVSSLIGLALSPAYNFGLVWGLWGWQGMGLQGAGIAAVVIQGTLVAVLVTYLLYRWGSGSSTALVGYADVLKPATW
jgi:hypothetical protein